MADPNFGIISDQAVYTAEAIAKLIGRNVKFTKQLLRDNFEIADCGGGLIFISGLNFRLGVERMSSLQIEDAEAPTTPTRRPRATK